ncbi:biotin--[acetyl-CoA-carboxylase] ligase [Arthrobacter sp. Sr24]
MNGTADTPEQSGLSRAQKLPAAAINPVHLDPARLRTALMHPQGAFARVDVVDSAGSTNTDLAAGAADTEQFFPDLSVLIADAQPAGKGRLGRAWEVPAGAAMISSVLVWPEEQCQSNGSGKDFSSTGYGWLSILAGIALCQALRMHTDVKATLKWPNDVLVNGRKLAGILAQVVPASTARKASPTTHSPSAPQAMAGSGAQVGPGVVVGVGVNVSLEESELPTDRATSLLVEGVPASGLDRNELLPAYLNNFAKLYQDFAAAGGDAQAPLPGGASAVDMARDLMSTLGQEVRAELPGGTMLYGTAVDLNSDGSLQLCDALGEEHNVSAGDVLHLRRTGPGGALGYA